MPTGKVDQGVFRDYVEQSCHCLDRREHQFFSRHLGQKNAWRSFSSFRDSCVYLDIETDGRAITTIGLFDGDSYTCLVRGESLENFRDIISRYAMIVTFCGTGFDLPTIVKSFPGLELDQIHLDLCPVLRKLGLRGGLKSIERQLGIGRAEEIDGLTGFDAVILWRRYIGLGDSGALERLIEYNKADVVNLKPLAEFAYTRMREAVLAS